MEIKRIAHDNTGSLILSALLGLGLAALFRSACRGDGCVVVRAPNLAEVQRHTYQVSQDACYKYTPEVVPCPRRGAISSASQP